MAGKKVLLLSVSAGHGHLRAADALAAGIRKWFPQHESRHIDLISLEPRLFGKVYKEMYLKLVKSHPRLWGYLYAKADSADADSKMEHLRRAVESACNKRLMPVLEEYRPDHIVCTHFMPMQFLLRWRSKGRISMPLWGCVTDFVAHRYWLEPGMQGYFTADGENVGRMKARGLADEDIRATGIPVLPGFIPAEDPEAARRAACAQFGLNPSLPVVPLMGGGAGVGNLLELVPQLLELPSRYQLVVLAGQNKDLLCDLQAMVPSFPGKLFPLGFTDEMPALLAASDFVITKPGGLTTVECLAMGKPMLIHSPIPGQEEQNADFLLENGAGLKAPDSFGLVWRVNRLLTDAALRERLANAALALGKPYAARDILSVVFGEQPVSK